MSWRYSLQLYSEAAVLKQTSPYYEWYYQWAVPFVHYVPVEYGQSDLVAKVAWLKENDAAAQKIARAGTAFAVEYFDPPQMLAYMATLLSHYAQLLDYTVEKREGARLVSKKKGCAKPSGPVLKAALGWS
jgi:hypothetical protein